MDLYDKVKGWLDLVGVKFGIGTGFSLSKMKATPYLKISFIKESLVDFGPIVNGLGEIGLTAGMRISKSTDKAKIWIDAGAVMDGDELFKSLQNHLFVPKIGFFGGFRITF